jgi:hypothetical protein
LPVRPVPYLQFRMAPPAGRLFTSLEYRPEDGTVDYRLGDGGVIEGEIRGLRYLTALEALYE